MTNYTENPNTCSRCDAYNCEGCRVVKGAVDPHGACDKWRERVPEARDGEFYLKEYQRAKESE